MPGCRSKSRGMLADRIAAIRKTTLSALRIMRRIVGSIVLRAIEADGRRQRASFVAVQTI